MTKRNKVRLIVLVGAVMFIAGLAGFFGHETGGILGITGVALAWAGGTWKMFIDTKNEKGD